MDKVTKIGDRIKSLRDETGTTQQALADALHVKRETINMWENGGRDLKTGSICDLAKFFNVSADYLLGLTEYKTTDQNIKNVCEVTGLSECAISILRNHKMNNGKNIDSFPALAIKAASSLNGKAGTIDVYPTEADAFLTFFDYFIRHKYSKNIASSLLSLSFALLKNTTTEELKEKYKNIIDDEDLDCLWGAVEQQESLFYLVSTLFDGVVHDISASISNKKYFSTPEEVRNNFLWGDQDAET